MRSVSSALLLAKRLRAAALVGDRYAVRFLGAAACEAAAAFGSLPVLLATWIFAPPQAGEKDERRFEKRNLCSRVPRLRVHVAVFWSDAKSRAVLGGTLGENAAWCSGHGSSAQEDGCGLSPAAGPARHVVLCGHRSVFSSPPGRQNVSPPRIFSTNPSCVYLGKCVCVRVLHVCARVSHMHTNVCVYVCLCAHVLLCACVCSCVYVCM